MYAIKLNREAKTNISSGKRRERHKPYSNERNRSKAPKIINDVLIRSFGGWTGKIGNTEELKSRLISTSSSFLRFDVSRIQRTLVSRRERNALPQTEDNNKLQASRKSTKGSNVARGNLVLNPCFWRENVI